MNKALRDQVMQLPPEERLELMDDIWDSLDEADVPLTPEQVQEMERRIAEHHADPSSSRLWEEVRAELWSKYG
jgi:putative addiction module component (TIGR02574 family)